MKIPRLILLVVLAIPSLAQVEDSVLETTRAALESRLRAEKERGEGAVEAWKLEASLWDLLGKGSAWRARDARRKALELEQEMGLDRRARAAVVAALVDAKKLRSGGPSGFTEDISAEGKSILEAIELHLPDGHSAIAEVELSVALAESRKSLDKSVSGFSGLGLVPGSWGSAEDAIHAFSLFSYAKVGGGGDPLKAKRALQDRIMANAGKSAREQAMDRIHRVYVLHLSGDFEGLSDELELLSSELVAELGPYPGVQFGVNRSGEEQVNLRTIYEGLQRKGESPDVGLTRLNRAYVKAVRDSRGTTHPAMARAYSATGSAALLGGDYRTATRRLKQALKLRREISTDKSVWVPFDLLQLAICIHMQGGVESAAAGFELAAALYRDLLSGGKRAGAFDELPTDLALGALAGAEPGDLHYRDERIDRWLKEAPTLGELKKMLSQQQATGKRSRQKADGREHKPSLADTMRLIRDLEREEERAEAERRGETPPAPDPKAASARARAKSPGVVAMDRVLPILAQARRHRATGSFTKALASYEELQSSLASVVAAAESATHEVDACEIQLEKAIVHDLLGQTEAAEQLLRKTLEEVRAIKTGGRRVASGISFHPESSQVFVQRELLTRLVLVLERDGRTVEADVRRRELGAVHRPGAGADADLSGLGGQMGEMMAALRGARPIVERSIDMKRAFVDGDYEQVIRHVNARLKRRLPADSVAELEALRAEASLLSFRSRGDMALASAWVKDRPKRTWSKKKDIRRRHPIERAPIIEIKGQPTAPAPAQAKRPARTPFAAHCTLLEARILREQGQGDYAAAKLKNLLEPLRELQQEDGEESIDYLRVLVAVEAELAAWTSAESEAIASARAAVKSAKQLRGQSPWLKGRATIDKDPKTEAEKLQHRLIRQSGQDPQDLVRQVEAQAKGSLLALQGGRDLEREAELGRVARPYRLLAELLLKKADAASRAEAVQLLGDLRELFVGSPGPEPFAVDATLAAAMADDSARREDALALARDLIDQLDGERRGVLGDEIDTARWQTGRLLAGDPYQIAADVVLSDVVGTAKPLEESATRTQGVLDLVERGRGLAYLRLMGKDSADLGELALARMAASGDKQVSDGYSAALQRVNAAEEAIARLDAELSKESVGSQVGALAEQRVALLEQRREAQAQLQIIAEPFLRHPARTVLGYAESREHLRQGELLLYYIVGESRSWVVYSLGGGDPRALPLRWPDGRHVTHDELELGVGDLLGAIAPGLQVQEPAQGSPTLSQLAYALLPVHVRKQLTQATRVLIVPDGPLHGLPFEVLPVVEGDETAKGLWLHTYPAVISGPSLTALLLARTAPKPLARSQQEVLAIGNPAFAEGRSPSRTGSAGELRWAQLLELLGSFQPLEFSGVEAEAVVRLVKTARSEADVVFLSGSGASVEGIDQALEGPRFLHFSTHGVSLGAPFVRDSCLALAGAGGDPGEGLLSLGAILDNWSGRLDSTELAVLSGCRTAAGTIESGNGAIALSWGFLFAGARSVLATRWNQDNGAAPLFMARFYSNILGLRGDAMPKADALLEAKRWIATLDRRTARESSLAYFNGEDVTESVEQIEDSGYWAEEIYAAPRIWAAYLLTGDMD